MEDDDPITITETPDGKRTDCHENDDNHSTEAMCIAPPTRSRGKGTEVARDTATLRHWREVTELSSGAKEGR